MCRPHHDGVPSAEARSTLIDVLTSGFVDPLNNPVVIEVLAIGGRDLFNRFIADGYSRVPSDFLTLDRQMASLVGARL